MQTGLGNGLSPAGAALGLGGGALRDQVANESDEERRKRMRIAQEQALMGPTGTPATLALFGAQYGAV